MFHQNEIKINTLVAKFHIFSKSFLVKDTSKSDFTLYAANGIKICTYSTKLFTLLKRKLQWSFIIVQVTKLIIGEIFLQHLDLLRDLKKRCLLHPVTNVTARTYASLYDAVVKTILDDSEYIELLKKYKKITQSNNMDKRNVYHDCTFYSYCWSPCYDYSLLRKSGGGVV